MIICQPTIVTHFLCLGLESIMPPILRSSSTMMIVAEVIAAVDPYGDLRTPWVARWRERASVASIYNCMGPTLFRRYYRMTYDMFWILHSMLKESIKDCIRAWRKRSVSSVLNATGGGREAGNYVNPPLPNGKIASSVRLACAIRYFSGMR